MKSESLERTLKICAVLLESIREAGDTGIPSGHLYAALMGVLDFDDYMTAISLLKQVGKVTESHYVLRAA